MRIISSGYWTSRVARHPRSGQAILAEALGLWRGPPLADFTYEPFAQRAITALSELRLVAIEDRMEAELAFGAIG